MNRKYNAMKVIEGCNSKASEVLIGGEWVLYSYDTPVAVLRGSEVVRLWDDYSATTMRHVNRWLEGRGDYVRFVSHPNFSGIGENGVNPGWDREGVRPRTADEIAEERREFLAASASRKSRANRARRRIRWHGSEGDGNI